MSIYNEQAKKKYIDYYMSVSQAVNAASQRRQLENFFSRLGEVERSFGVDIAEADYETAILILNQVGKGGVRSDGNKLAICNQYADWAIENGYARNFENKIASIKSEDLDKSAVYRMTMVKDERELVNYLDFCFSDINSNSTDIVFRTFAILIFNGVAPKLVPDLKADSADLVLKTIRVEGSIINISDIACEYIRIMNNLVNYIVPRGDLTPRVTPKANTGHLLETSTSNRDNLLSYFRVTLSKAPRKYYDATHMKKSLNSNSIYKSGMFYRAWMQECNGVMSSLEEYFMSCSSLLKCSKGNLLLEYKHWKKAFNL